MEKKIYSRPDFEMLVIDGADIISTSTCPTGYNPTMDLCPELEGEAD